MDITIGDSQTFKITGANSSSDDMKVEVKPTPGKDDGKRYTLTVTPTTTDQPIRSVITLTMDNPAIPTTKLTLHARLIPARETASAADKLVRQAFSNQVDEAMTWVDRIEAGKPIREAADLPLVSRAFARQPVGMSTGDVEDLSALEGRYNAIRARIDRVAEQYGVEIAWRGWSGREGSSPKGWYELDEAARAELAPLLKTAGDLVDAHDAMLQANRGMDAIRKLRREAQPDWEAIRALELKIAADAADAMRR